MQQVNSFDVFDTLIARNCRSPSDIFDIVERDCPCKDFKRLRINAEKIAYDIHGMKTNIDDIYNSLKQLIDYPDMEQLKNFELKTEMENSIPITSNINKVKDGDIYISDMYLKPEQIYSLLEKHNINTKNKLYVSSGGKQNGSMYKELLRTYKIGIHTGDNIESDIRMAKRFNISTFHTQIHGFTSTEQMLYEMGLYDFQMNIRKCRLENPYPETSIEYKIYHQQVTYNIPLLIIFSFQLKEILETENRTKILFVTRDCCLLYKIFNWLFPEIEIVYYASSRTMHVKPSIGYIEYMKQHYVDNTTLIVDLYGSFRSGRNLYKQVFGVYPRVHVLVYENAAPTFDTFSYSINSKNIPEYTSYIETLNYDLRGTLFGMVQGVELRTNNENDEYKIRISHDVVERFMKSNEVSEYVMNFHKHNEYLLCIYKNVYTDKNDLGIHIFPSTNIKLSKIIVDNM